MAACPLSPPAATAVEHHLRQCHLAAAVECRQTLSPDQTPLIAATVVYCYPQTLPPPNANARYEHLPHSNTDACNYNARVCNATGDHRTAIFSYLDADDVVQGQCVMSAVIILITPHPRHPPTAFHRRLQPLLIVEYVVCQFWHLYSCPHPPSPSIYPPNIYCCVVRT